MLRNLDVCAGISASTTAWKLLGWKVVQLLLRLAIRFVRLRDFVVAALRMATRDRLRDVGPLLVGWLLAAVAAFLRRKDGLRLVGHGHVPSELSAILINARWAGKTLA
jgi:hypothetical protein